LQTPGFIAGLCVTLAIQRSLPPGSLRRISLESPADFLRPSIYPHPNRCPRGARRFAGSAFAQRRLHSAARWKNAFEY
jgi:hypothetical protein